MDSFETLNFDESDVFLPTNIDAIDAILGKLDLFSHVNLTLNYANYTNVNFELHDAIWILES
jgi:hypothetical protein